MSKTALVIQGGGFRTAFTAGVLDSFLVAGAPNFDHFVGVSGGTIALSYFLSGQYGFCLEAMILLSKDPQFVKFSRAMSDAGYMDIDYLDRIANEIMPLDKAKAVQATKGKDIHFVATDRETAEPAYLQPLASDWIEKLIASCTLPFVTKGKHLIDDKEYFDGGWSDPIPARWAYDQGATDILVIRTARVDVRITQSWPDYFGSVYFRKNPSLKKSFDNSHSIYNESLDFLENPPVGVKIRQIAPEQELKSGTYSYSSDSLIRDYRHGLDLGLYYLQRQRKLSKTGK